MNPVSDSVISPIIDDIIDPIVPLSSPVTKTYSRTGISPAAKQRENDAFDMMMSSSSPKIDEKYFLPSAIAAPDQDQELISFESPALDQNPKAKKQEIKLGSRRSSRIRTPMK